MQAFRKRLLGDPPERRSRTSSLHSMPKPLRSISSFEAPAPGLFKTTPAQLDGNGVIERPEGTNRLDSPSLHRKQKRRTTPPPPENGLPYLRQQKRCTTPPPPENGLPSPPRQQKRRTIENDSTPERKLAAIPVQGLVTISEQGLDALRRNHTRERSEAESLEEELKEQRARHMRERSKAESLEEELKEQRAWAATDAQNSQAKIVRLQGERDNLRKRVIAMEDYFKIEGVTFGDLEKMGELKDELTVLQSANDDMKIHIKKLKVENDSLQELVEALHHKMDDMKIAHEKEMSEIVTRHVKDMNETQRLGARLLHSMTSQQKTLDKDVEALKDTHGQTIERLVMAVRESRDLMEQQERKAEAEKAALLSEIAIIQRAFGKMISLPRAI
jgi:hypothetical protein